MQPTGKSSDYDHIMSLKDGSNVRNTIKYLTSTDFNDIVCNTANF